MDRIGLAIIIVGAALLVNGTAASSVYAAPLGGLGAAGPATEMADTSVMGLLPELLDLDTEATTRQFVETKIEGLGAAEGSTDSFDVRS